MKNKHINHKGLLNKGGRNNRGRITIRHRGTRHKRLYRQLEYTQNGYKYNLSGLINLVEYDPNRSANIAQCSNGNKIFYKILGGLDIEPKIGQTINVVKLKSVGIGDSVFNVSQRPGQLGKYGRASGTTAIVLKQTETTTVLRLPSREIKIFNNNNICSLGSVYSVPQIPLTKAGNNRWLGLKPRVKGRAMNCIDHPNGGKTAGGGQPKTVWGKLAKWVPTKRSKLVRV